MVELEQVIESICESVRFDSSRAERSEQMPFGKGAHDCLHHFLSLAQSLGFQTKNYDNYIGEVLYGSGEETFAILAHLDVVPAGSGWTKPPFGGVVADGRIWGRGTTDDKGPAICALYALKALKDEGFAPGKTIKLIVGCNEEDGWECIEHYNRVAQMPETGFSPDADFPVIYAEKGILHVKLRFPVQNPPFLSLSGGTGANMVCAECRAEVASVDRERAAALGLRTEGNTLLSFGKSAHGSTPELGVNAIYPMLKYFGGDMNRILDCVFGDIYGLKTLRDETGPLTLSPDIIEYADGEVQILCDIRYPATVDIGEVLARLDRFGVRYEEVHHQRPLIQDKNGALVQTLLSVYEECTGTSAEPIAIGGGTYARALKNGVAFGPEVAGEDSGIHQADEFISVERVKLLLEVYRKAIERLTK